MDEIEESRRPLIIPAHAKIERQPVGNLPVILDIDAELEILRIDDRATVAGLGAELKAIWNIVVDTTAGRERGVIGLERVEIAELERVELAPLGLCADLDRVAFEHAPGEIVLDPPAFLPLFLSVAS